MHTTRRHFLSGLAVVGATGQALPQPLAAGQAGGAGAAPAMYGLIGKIIAASGQRDALIEILLDGTAAMPGCLSYIVARDPAEADAIWITEVWDSEASHQASLALPAVQAAIGKGRPLIAGFGDRIVTAPVGGAGLSHRG